MASGACRASTVAPRTSTQGRLLRPRPAWTHPDHAMDTPAGVPGPGRVRGTHSAAAQQSRRRNLPGRVEREPGVVAYPSGCACGDLRCPSVRSREPRHRHLPCPLRAWRSAGYRTPPHVSGRARCPPGCQPMAAGWGASMPPETSVHGLPAALSPTPQHQHCAEDLAPSSRAHGPPVRGLTTARSTVRQGSLPSGRRKLRSSVQSPASTVGERQDPFRSGRCHPATRRT